MASGTIKGKFTVVAATNLYPEIRWSSTKNDTNNTSSVKAELWFIKVNSAWYPYNLAGYASNISINGNNQSSLRTFDLRSRSSQKIWERTVTVAHNADGNKSINISSGGSIGIGNMGSVSVSGTAKLDTIPRASSIGTISGNQIGSAITIPISRASSSFTHDVSLKLGSQTVSVTGVGTSATLTPNLANFCGQLPNSTSGSATITVKTKSGSTVIGTKTKNHTIYVPSSVVPSVTSFNTDENVSAVSNLALGANVFVQNKSTIRMTASAKGVHGSTIKDYTFSFNGVSQGGTVGRNFSVGNINGTREVKVVITDSRGRKAERKHNVTIRAYQAPKVNKFNVYRDGQTTQVKADVSYTITNLAKTGANGGNWYIDKLVGSTWTLTNNGKFENGSTTYSANGLVLAGAYDTTKSYDFRTNLHDVFGIGSTATGSISTAKTLLDLDRDIGVGIGKMRENGVLDVGGAAYFNENIVMEAGKQIQKGGGFYNGNLPSGNLLSPDYWHQSLFPVGMSIWFGTPDLGLTNAPTSYGFAHVFKDPSNEVSVQWHTQNNGAVYRTGTNRLKYGMSWFIGFEKPNLWAKPGDVLWTGGVYMSANQTVTPSKPIGKCPNGWVLVWSDNDEGVQSQNWDWSHSLVSKGNVNLQSGNNNSFIIPSYASGATNISVNKILYVHTNRIIGHDNNQSTANQKDVVLRRVIAW